ncbi:TPA: transglutaminase [Streptococcus suis]|nr:transglutaminase [Streptococcus suis]
MKDYLSTRKLAVLVLLSFSLSSLTACSTNQVEEKLQELQATFSQEKKELEAELRQLEKEVAGNFYFQQLDTDKERRVYLQFVNGLRKRENTIELDSVNQELYTRVYFSVANDYPEFYWLTDEMSDGISLSDLSLPGYPKDYKEIMKKIEDTAFDILSMSPQGSDYEKVRYFYEYIINQTDYDVNALTNDSLAWKRQSVTSVLLDRKSVCAGYSRTFQYLCKLSDIECIYVSGMARDVDGTEFGHAWNLVNIAGNFYGVDTTWGDPVFDVAIGGGENQDISYDYLCVTDQLLETSRVADRDLLSYWGNDYPYQSRELSYPVCDDNSLNYYVVNKYYFESFDKEKVLDSISSQIALGNQKVSLQFSDRASLEQMLQYIESQDSKIFQAFGENISTYQYSSNEQTNTLQLTNWE